MIASSGLIKNSAKKESERQTFIFTLHLHVYLSLELKETTKIL